MINSDDLYNSILNKEIVEAQAYYQALFLADSSMKNGEKSELDSMPANAFRLLNSMLYNRNQLSLDEYKKLCNQIVDCLVLQMAEENAQLKFDNWCKANKVKLYREYNDHSPYRPQEV